MQVVPFPVKCSLQAQGFSVVVTVGLVSHVDSDEQELQTDSAAKLKDR